MGKGWGRICYSTCSKDEWETTNTVIHISDGVREVDLGMVTVFCQADQARIEACDALFTVCQCDSSELSMVVVRRYSNTHYIPRGISHALYLDMGTFPRGHYFHPISPGQVASVLAIPFSESEVLLPNEVEEEGLKTYPILPEFLCKRSEEEHNVSNPISLSIPLPAPAPRPRED